MENSINGILGYVFGESYPVKGTIVLLDKSGEFLCIVNCTLNKGMSNIIVQDEFKDSTFGSSRDFSGNLKYELNLSSPTRIKQYGNYINTISGFCILNPNWQISFSDYDTSIKVELIPIITNEIPIEFIGNES